VFLGSDEQKFMEASLAYVAGRPILTDQQYDELKMKLKTKGSKVAIAGPRCSLRSKKVVSDSTVDYLKMTLLNVPAALVALTLVFFLDDITGFEITYLLELPEPYSFVVTWFIVLPITFFIAQALTNTILKEALILKVNSL
jgi:sterol desaturase/sphingolipid hydroxylase (fatty acid hydroxylase superfamily)